MRFNFIHGAIFLMVILVSYSCDRKAQSNLSGAIARVDESYLFKKDIEGLVPEGTAVLDSVAIVKNYIHTWASKKIIMSASENNMNEEVVETIDRLVAQYKADLYTNSYIERLVSKSLDTIVKEQDVQLLYDETKAHFTLNENLVKLRLIVMPNDHQDYEEIATRFKRFNNEDQNHLESIGMQLNQFALNQDDWVETNTLLEKFPFITSENEKEFWKENHFVQEKDSLQTYLLKINAVLLKGDESPFEYQRSTLKDIILNRRKLKLIDQLKKEITNNAIKDEKFEVFK